MDLNEFRRQQDEQEQEYQELVNTINTLSATIDQLKKVIDWCGQTFPELQEGGEYEECWKAAENLLLSAKEIAKPYKVISPFKSE